MLSPSPQPSLLSCLVPSTILKAWKSFVWSSSLIPIPVSSTDNLIRPLRYDVVSRRHSSLTLMCPLNVNFSELPTRLSIIYFSLVGSVLIVSGTSGCISLMSWRFLMSAFIYSSTRMPVSSSRRLTSSKTSLSSWKLDLVKSKMSYIRLNCKSQQ